MAAPVKKSEQRMNPILTHSSSNYQTYNNPWHSDSLVMRDRCGWTLKTKRRGEWYLIDSERNLQLKSVFVCFGNPQQDYAMGRNIGGIAVACCCDGLVLPQVAHLEVFTQLQAVPGNASLRSFIAAIEDRNGRGSIL